MKQKRFLGILLTLTMLASLLPTFSLTASGANISTSSSAIAKGHFIYFGNSSQKWKVLSSTQTSMGTEGMFLISDKSLGQNESYITSAYYDKNGMQKWCTDYYNGTNFSPAEKNVMLATTVGQTKGSYNGTNNVINTALNGDKLFLLSAEEAYNSAYFANDNARKINEGFNYADWTLRSYNISSGVGGNVEYFGFISNSGKFSAVIAKQSSGTAGKNGLSDSKRPGFNLDKSQILFVTAATDGKTEGFSSVSNSGNEWKLTLKDDKSFADGASLSSTAVCAGLPITLKHKALSSISADYTNVTAAIYKGETMLYYGSINNDKEATSTDILFPADLESGVYTLKVYGEDWNGDKKTDIATATPYSVDITIGEHTGGTATCSSPKICTVCNKEYGEKSSVHSQSVTANGFYKCCLTYQKPELKNGVYQIKNAGNLFWFSDLVNGILEDVEKDSSANAILVNDIELTKGSYFPIIAETPLYYKGYGTNLGYKGTFDGNNKVIRNLKIRSSGSGDASAGLFGTLSGEIKNLGIEDFTFVDGGKDMRTGAVVGQVIKGGRVSNCYVKNAVIDPGEHVTGGIAGCVYEGTIENCYVVDSVLSGTKNRYGYIVGDTRGDGGANDRPATVTNCYTDKSPAYSGNTGNINQCEIKTEGFASGEIAYLLNGDAEDAVWYQNIDNGKTVDAYPVPDKTHGKVYYGYKDCEAVAMTYTNYVPRETPGHSGMPASCIENSLCSYCFDTVGGVDPDRHASNQTYFVYIDDTVHGEYYKCCHKLKAEHHHTETPAVACTDGSYCEVCKSAYSFTTTKHMDDCKLVWEMGINYHYQKYSRCGVVAIEREPHNLTCTLDEETNIITVACTDCPSTGTATMSIDDGEYNGFPFEAKYEGTDLMLSDFYSPVKVTYTYCCPGGCKHPGEHSVTMQIGDVSITEEFTIYKKELTIGNIQAFYKEYDGSKELDLYAVTLDGVVIYDEGDTPYEFDDVTDDVEIDVSQLVAELPNSVPGSYRTAVLSNIVLVGADSHNYALETAYDSVPLQNSYGYAFTLAKRGVHFTAKDQTAYGNEAIKQSEFTVENLPDNIVVDGVILEADEYFNEIHINYENAVFYDKDGKDVTDYFMVQSVLSGNLSRVCDGHFFNGYGFCGKGACDIYKPAVLNDNDTPDEEYDDYYEIYNAGQLYWYAQQVNEYGNSTSAKLMNDIYVNEDLSAQNLREWTPIHGLYAEFDGNGFMIDGLYINQPDRDYIGFLGRDGYGSVKNLTITNSYFKGNDNVGTFGGNTGTEFINCVADGSVTVVGSAGSKNVGGIAGGYSGGTFTNNISYANVNGAGLIGNCMGYATNSYTTSDKVVNTFYPGYGEITGIYYLNDEETDEIEGTTAMSADDFASGKVAYLLQSNVPEEDIYDDDWNRIETITPHVWGQEIGSDIYPVLGGAKVYEDTHNESKAYRNEIDGFEVLRVGEDAKSATVVLENPGTYVVIFSDYDDSNRLLNVDMIEVEVDEAKAVCVSSDKGFTLGNSDKIMLWSNEANLAPKCAAYIVN